MGLALAFIAAVFAYSAAGMALWFGAGWLTALLLLFGVGTGAVLGLALVVIRSASMETAPIGRQLRLTD